MKIPLGSGMGTDYSFHDGGKLRPGIPFRTIATDAAPVTKPARFSAFTRDAEPEPTKPEPSQTESENTMNNKQVLDVIKALQAKGMSSDDILDALVAMAGGDPAPSEPDAPAETALDRAYRVHGIARDSRPVRLTPANLAAREAMFPNRNRLFVR